MPGVTQTMPLAVYLALQTDLDAAVALSVLLLALSVGVLLGIRLVTPRLAAQPALARRLLGNRRGEFELDLALQAAAARTTVTRRGERCRQDLGPPPGRGARPSRPRARRLDGELYTDTAADLHVPPWRRRGLRPPGLRTLPPSVVAENVAFGLRAAGVRSGEIRPGGARRSTAPASRRWPAASPRPLRRPAAARRARPGPGARSAPAAARRAARRPRSADPAAVRGELRPLLRELGTTLYVTHSPIEALLFGDHIVVLEGGRISQVGAGRAAAPSSIALCRGARRHQLLRGTGDGDRCGRDRAHRRWRSRDLPRGGSRRSLRHRESAGHHPAHPAPEGSARTSSRVRPRARAGAARGRACPGGAEHPPPLVAEVTREAVSALSLTDGAWVYAAFKATGVHRYA